VLFALGPAALVAALALRRGDGAGGETGDRDSE
jgi:hypothetical protein